MGPKLGGCGSCGGWWCCFRSACDKTSRMYWRGRTRVWAPPSGDPESLQGIHSTVSFERDGPPSGGTSRSVPLGKFWPVRRRFRRTDSESVSTCLEEADVGVARDIAPGDVSSSSFGLNNSLRGRYTVFAARLSIMVMLTILIGVLTILTWHFTTAYTTKSIETLAYNLRMDILERPVNRMRAVLNTTVAVTVAHTHLVAYVFSRHTNPGQMSEISTVMRNVTWAIFASQPMITTLHVIYKNGITQGYKRMDSSDLQYYSYTLPLNETAAEVAASPALSPVGNLANASEDFVSYAATNEFSWYEQEVEDADSGPKMVGLPSPTVADFNLSVDFNGFDLLQPGDIAWHATVHQSSPVPCLAAGSTVRDSDTGEVLAITGTTQELSSVNYLMEQLVALHSGTMYLISTNGLLLASSTSAPLLRNTTNGPTLLLASESSDPIIKASSIWLRNAYGMSATAANLQNVHRENIVLLGNRHYVDTFVLNLTRLPLIGVIVTPRSAVLGEVDRRGHATLAILLSVSACFLLVGCFCTLLFTNGVSNEMKLRVELINHLHARRRAEASSTYKSQFLANMSHELRTPMAAVIGLLDIMLSDESMTSEQVAMLSQIRQCSTALLRLLNNILDLSKVESGKLVLEDEEFDLRYELAGLVDMFAVQCSDQRIEIVLDLADDLPRTLVGDSGRIVQVFANLIANSIKFTSTGHVVIRGSCEPPPFSGALLYPRNDARNERVSRSGIVDYSNPRLSTQSIAETAVTEDGLNLAPDKICVWFEIDDTGCGIDPRKWETVFGSFVQADPSTTRTHGGTGLGLCIVRSLVQQMGGEIKVAKKDGPGTLLRFFLLFKHSQESSPPKTFDDHISSSLPLETLRHSKVVFALQGKTGRGLMTKWMIRRELHVQAAASWEEAITELDELLQEDDEVPSSYRLAILDISLVSKSSDLDELDKYVLKGVRIAWLLNHDTSSIIKNDLRKRGYSIMANKPVFKSKLLHLLRMLMDLDTDVDYNSFAKPETLKRDLTPGRRSIQYDVEQHFMDGQLPTSKQQISEQVFQEDSPSLPDSTSFLHRNSPADPFPIYKPNSYIQPDAIGTNKAKMQRNSIEKVHHEEAESEKGLSQEEVLVREDMGPRAEVMEPLAAHQGNGSGRDLDSSMRVIDPLHETSREQVDAGASADRRVSNEIPYQGLKVMALNDTPTLEALRTGGTSSLPDSRQENASTRVGDPQVVNDGGNAPVNVDPQIENQNNVSSRQSVSLHQVKSSTPPPAAESSPFSMRQSLASSRFGPRDALKGIRILLAEDTLVLQRVATLMLEKMGATVIAVTDGLQAVDALTMSLENEATDVGRPRVLKYPDPTLLPFDLVLMDCQMPKMDGYDATRAIREAELGTICHIPIVALTAHAMSSDEAKCLEVGMDAYLTKPIDSKLMQSTIISLTKGRTLRCENSGGL